MTREPCQNGGQCAPSGGNGGGPGPAEVCPNEFGACVADNAEGGCMSIMLAMGLHDGSPRWVSAETEDIIANTVFEQVRPSPARARRPCAPDSDTPPRAQLCTATQAATDDAASTLQTHKVAANVDEASWFCCCPKRYAPPPGSCRARASR